MRFLLLFALLFCVACQSAKTGLTYIDKGWSVEASVFRTEENVPLGLRASVGEIWLPPAWEADHTMRYALGPYLQIPLWEKKVWYPHTSSSYTTGIYIEPRFEVAYYPELGTPFEPETGLRLIYKYDFFEAFIGARLPVGNGWRHENAGEYEHTPAGIHPEFGIVWGFDF